ELFGEGGQELSKFADALLPNLDISPFEIERGSSSHGQIAQATHSEQIAEFLQSTFQIVAVEFRIAILAAPEDRMAAAGHGDGEAPLFPDGAILPGEDAADLKQGGIVVLMVGIMTERIQQPRQQARAEHSHIGTERVGESDERFRVGSSTVS